MMKKNNRKPFSDLTNKLSAVSLSDDGNKPGPKKSFSRSSNSQEKPRVRELERKDDGVVALSPVHVPARLDSRLSSVSISLETQVQGESKAAVRVLRKPNIIITNYETMSPSGDHMEAIREEPEVTSSLNAETSPFFPKNLSPVFLYPPPSLMPAPAEELVAIVKKPGYISLKMRHGMILDISNDLSVRVNNPGMQSSIAMSGDSRHVAIIHPQGRALVYHPRVEIQVEDRVSVKNAKFYPKGISFTANNLALVYLLDEAGARTTSDIFHDLHGTNIVEIVFKERIENQQNSVSRTCEQLDRIRYWRNENNGVNCWIVDDLSVRQAPDGFVMLDRTYRDGSRTSLRVSPTNGRVKIEAPSVQASASLSEEAHFFLRSGSKRLHYSGKSGAFSVRSSGQNVGFDQGGNFKIY